MGIISGKVNLAALTHVLMNKQGKEEMVEGIFIPIKINNLFKGKEAEGKHPIYLDTIAFEMTEKKDYGTHIIKQSLPKDVRAAMSEEEQKDFEKVHREEITDVLGADGVWFNTEVLIAVGEK